MLEKLRKYPMTAVLVIAIWIVCLIPVPETPMDNIRFIDKWTHFVMYGTLTLCIWYENYRNDKALSVITRLGKGLWLGGFVCPVIMGGLIELAQAYLTTCRSGDWFDFLCNGLGVCLGCAIAIIAQRTSCR